EDSENLAQRGLLIVKRMTEDPVKLATVLVAGLIVVSIVLIGMMVGMVDEVPEAAGGLSVLDIQKMETFQHTLDGDYYLTEGEPVLFPYDFYHTLELPGEFGEIVVCLVDYVAVSITWVDEPDESRGPVTWENQPDTVSAAIYDSDRLVFEAFDEQTNPRGGVGSILLEWRGDGEYLEQSWRRNDEHNWEGVHGEDYVKLKNGNVNWHVFVDGDLMLTSAGDQTHPRLPVGYTDDGNSLQVSVTQGGRCVSLAPGTYVDPE
ncbi:MAG: hypothetical protein JSW25_06680, partial [Thermoplasmata archaeon]